MVRPLSKRSKLTNRKLKFIIPSCWIAGFLWNVPLFVAVTYREDLETCGEQWSYEFSPIVYSIGWNIVAGVIPISIMSYLYSRVVCKLWFDKTPVLNSTSAVSTMEERFLVHLPRIWVMFDYFQFFVTCFHQPTTVSCSLITYFASYYGKLNFT